MNKNPPDSSWVIVLAACFYVFILIYPIYDTGICIGSGDNKETIGVCFRNWLQSAGSITTAAIAIAITIFFSRKQDKYSKLSLLKSIQEKLIQEREETHSLNIRISTNIEYLLTDDTDPQDNISHNVLVEIGKLLSIFSMTLIRTSSIHIGKSHESRRLEILTAIAEFHEVITILAEIKGNIVWELNINRFSKICRKYNLAYGKYSQSIVHEIIGNENIIHKIGL